MEAGSDYQYAGPQREIFAGGTKIYAGPSKLGEEQKKRSSLKFGPSFSPKLGEEQRKKKKVFAQIWSQICPCSESQIGPGEKIFAPELNATASTLPGLLSPGPPRPGYDVPPEPPPLVGPANLQSSKSTDTVYNSKQISYKIL